MDPQDQVQRGDRRAQLEARPGGAAPAAAVVAVVAVSVDDVSGGSEQAIDASRAGWRPDRRRWRATRRGVYPSALVEGVNQPEAAAILGRAEGYAMVGSLGDVGAVIGQARPDSLARLYRDLRLEVHYRHAPDGGEATATIGVANECVRGGT